ncbi:MAG: 2-C-methyl-D-erythritol 4-phosphate cytidylyltransferase [Actinomycetota bacterium]|nr:2-C-methyl-D-erythritol 4-phosphate cytidylyltransferase [Actinomycetota bacterium]
MPDEPVAVVLAAGVGSRTGHELPKQFLDLNGRPVLARTVANLAWCRRVVVVHHPEHLDRTREVLRDAAPPDRLVLVPGGATRRLSVAAALAAVADLPDAVPLVLQNAASPNTPVELVEQCVAALESYDVAQAYVPAVHTVFEHENGELARVLPRVDLGYSADPTVYRLGCLRRIAAAQAAAVSLGEMTLDTARALGIPVRLVPSPDTNIKLTTVTDLLVLQQLTAT